MNRMGFRGYVSLLVAGLALLLTEGCVSRGPAKRVAKPPVQEAVTPVTLEWSTWIGGDKKDGVNAIAVDAEGNAYVTGGSMSDGWTTGGLDNTQNGKDDAYVAKIRPDGTLAWSTYLGGSEDDGGSAITVGSDGNIYVLGQTKSTEWLKESSPAKHHGGNDVFVAVLPPDGSRLLWSTYLGGVADEVGYGITVDKKLNVLITGITKTLDWDASTSDSLTYDPKRFPPNAFVSCLNKGDVKWTLLLGGDRDDTGRGIGTDAKGNIYISGWTESSSWTLNSGIETGLKGPRDAFIARISRKGKLRWVKCLGGDKSESSYAIAVDNKGFPCVSGRTNTNGWVENGFDTDQNGTWDAMAARLTPSGKVIWSTFVGGNRLDTSRAIAVDAKGNQYVVGLGDSGHTWFQGGPDLTYGGDRDGFLVKVAANGSGILWGTYIGGSGEEMAYAVTVDSKNDVFVGGMAKGSEWVAGGFDTTYNGGDFDGYVVKYRQ